MFTKTNLVEFGNYLLSKERKDRVSEINQNTVVDADFDHVEFTPVGDSPGPYGLLHLGRGNFGEAVKALKEGKKVCRSGWNGKNMFLFLLPAGTIPKTAIHDPALRQVLENNGKDHFEALGSIRMKTADDKILTGWLASQTDMLSEDWLIID